jgi:hypothetical protein
MHITSAVALCAIRWIHTVVWAFFAGIILAIPVVGLLFGLVRWLVEA